MSGTIVYLDICALKRPFDDARSERIRREAEAVARIFEEAEKAAEQRDQMQIEVVLPDQLLVDEENEG